jgi:hypothetical protein
MDIHALSGIRTHDPSVRASEVVHALDRAAAIIRIILQLLRLNSLYL